MLEVGFNNGAHFLQLWQAWQLDANHPKLLHVVAVDSVGSVTAGAVAASSDLDPLAKQLKAQLWGLLPGFHRLVFEGGRITLTLCLGAVNTQLEQQQFAADSVLLTAWPQDAGNDERARWNIHTLKKLARLCERGAQLACLTPELNTPALLAQCGFVVETPVNPTQLQARFNPGWPIRLPRGRPPLKAPIPGTCVVVGAGLAGSAVAASLARRGWQVTVLDRAIEPASGASSLPAGLLVPHLSPDDSQLSRLSRVGVRATLQQAETLLAHSADVDWSAAGVLTLGGTDSLPSPPPGWSTLHAAPARDWGYTATPDMLAHCNREPEAREHASWWHAKAGWVKPASLVHAFLASPGVAWQGNCAVKAVKQTDNGWAVLDDAGDELAQARVVVLAAAFETAHLAAAANAPPVKLQPIRGQITIGSTDGVTASLPPFPVNGHGGFIPSFTAAGHAHWLMGASYERDAPTPHLAPQDHAENFSRLHVLLPIAAHALHTQFNGSTAQGWAGVRCATPDRLPLVSQLQAHHDDDDGTAAQLWACTGMGSRGLTFAVLCAELLAATLHNEPLPMERKLADALRKLER